jgi:hypothetical protein
MERDRRGRDSASLCRIDPNRRTRGKHMEVKFLFMDEKYADDGAPAKARATALVGILVPAASHPSFRSRFYELLAVALGATKTVIPAIPKIHASELFPGRTDEERFAFLEGLVTIVNELGFRVYRVGYLKTPKMIQLIKSEKNIPGLCFGEILRSLESELVNSAVWPVMETDGSEPQDQAFGGTLQFVDYAASLIGKGSISLDTENLGEVLYSRKRSAHGALVDCVTYLLHMKWLRSIGLTQTPYKEHLADIASGLDPAIAVDEIIRMRVGLPPEG